MAMQSAFDATEQAYRPVGAVARDTAAENKRKGSDGAFS
jgi:hypothetical protein